MKNRFIPVVAALILAGIACGPLGGTPTLPPRRATDPPDSLPPRSATESPSIDPLAGWITYSNADCEYEIRVPPGSTITPGTDSDRIDLPFASGTNLREKWIEVTCEPIATGCSSMLGEGSREFNGTMFSFYEAADAGAGNYWNWITYTAPAGTMCTDLSFTIHSVNAMNYTPPIPEYDETAETAVYDEIMETFTWW
jgi:hypothetical protein